MAKSQLAKYAERLSLAIIALIIAAWVALTFFADDSQDSDPVALGQGDQIDGADAPQAGAGAELGDDAPDDGEANAPVSGQPSGSSSTTATSGDAVAGDEATEGGSAAADAGGAFGTGAADGDRTDQVDQPVQADGADDPDTSSAPRDDTPDGNEAIAPVSGQPSGSSSTTATSGDAVAGDEATEGGSAAADAGGVSGTDAAVNGGRADQAQPAAADSSGEPNTGAGSEPDDATEDGDGADPVSDQSSASSSASVASGDATAGSETTEGESSAADAGGVAGTGAADGDRADQASPADVGSDGTDPTADQPEAVGPDAGSSTNAETQSSTSQRAKEAVGSDADGEDGSKQSTATPDNAANGSEAVASDGGQAGQADAAAKLDPITAPDPNAEMSAAKPRDGARESEQDIAKLDTDSDSGKTEPREDAHDLSRAEIAILPTFDIVRVDQYGFVTLAGRGMPDAEIEVLVNSELAESGQIDARGQFALVFQLDIEASPLEIMLFSRDSRGTEHLSDETVVVFAPESLADIALGESQLESAEDLLPAVLIATPEQIKLEQPPIPAQPTGSLGYNLQIDSISYDMTGEAVVAGRGGAGGLVRIYLDDKPIRTERIPDDGNWEVALPEVDAGRYMLRVEELNQPGDVVASITTPFQKEFRENAAAIMREAALSLENRSAFGLGDGRIADIVTVQPGYTLWAISRSNLGQGRFYVRIYHANIDQIDDPDLIFPGQLLVIPNLETVPPRRPFD